MAEKNLIKIAGLLIALGVVTAIGGTLVVKIREEIAEEV